LRELRREQVVAAGEGVEGGDGEVVVGGFEGEVGGVAEGCEWGRGRGGGCWS